MSNPFAITVTKKVGDTQFVGVHLPKQLADELAVYAIYRGISKQTVIQEMVGGCLAREIPIEKIIDRLSDRAVSHWRTTWRENLDKKGWRTDEDEAKRLGEFRIELKKSLARRGVTKQHITEILKPLTEEKNK